MQEGEIIFRASTLFPRARENFPKSRERSKIPTPDCKSYFYLFTFLKKEREKNKENKQTYSKLILFFHVTWNRGVLTETNQGTITLNQVGWITDIRESSERPVFLTLFDPRGLFVVSSTLSWRAISSAESSGLSVRQTVVFLG